jgi:hypothetical protein
MKRIKFCILLSFFFGIISCGDNNGGDPGDYHHPYVTLEGIFPDLTTGRELILVYNGDTLKNKKVTFVSRGSSAKPQAILTFENVISSEAKTELRVDLIETVNPNNSVLVRLLFEGIYSTKSHSVKYSGYIDPMQLSLFLIEE